MDFMVALEGGALLEPQQMLYIEDTCRTLTKFLSDFLSEDKSVVFDQNFSDFEDTKLHAYVHEDSVFISITSLSIKAIKDKFDVKSELDEYMEQSGLEFGQVENGYDFTVTLKKGRLSDSSIEKVSKLRFEILSIPLKKAFECVKKKSDGSIFVLPLKNDESMHILPYSDRVMVTFSIQFEDQSDSVLGKVFLQEFNDTRQKQTVQNAPTVIFGKEPPPEMTKFIKNPSSKLHYISFVLIERHFSPGERSEKAISLLVNFRSYLHYHIKSTKAYLHNRMRIKVSDFIKVLNRAKPEYLPTDN